MLLYLQRRDGSSELRHIEIGHILVGLRWTSLVIENHHEAAKLLTEAGQEWWKRHIIHGFVKPRL